jgi:dolichyl-phosphate-mannose-protein mannosyltransferase
MLPLVVARNQAYGARWRTIDTLMIVAVTLVGGLLRFVGLGDPRDIVFDETYYAKDACWYATSSHQLCGVEGEQTAVHPTLGKWIIAAGIKLFGYDSFGWRVASALAGTITIALLYLLARKLLRSSAAAGVVAMLFALDFLHFVQSRIAMLDVFVPLFGVAALLFIVVDRDVLLRGPPFPRGVLRRPWRLAAGVAVGASAASKWPGAFFAVVVLLLSVAWEYAARRSDEQSSSLRRVLREQGMSIAIGLVLVPLLVYVATFAGRIHGAVFALPWHEGSWLRALWDRNLYMFRFHYNLEATHLYQSPPWSWIFVKRPVSYFYEATDAGASQEILALGNPIVWWISIPALVYVAFKWLTIRDFSRAEGAILAGFLLTYGPWLVQPSARSATFIFYLLPTVPFMYLAIGSVATTIGNWWPGRVAVALFAMVVIVSFAYFYPVLTKQALPRKQWAARMWFESCDRTPAKTTTSTTLQTKVRATLTRTSVSTLEESPPPEGWCWI